MDISLLTSKTINTEDISHADYFLDGDVLSFSRDIEQTPTGSNYNSYSSMVDNLIYQPLWVKNSYELGKSKTETESISLGSNSFIFDRIPKGIKKIIYKGSGVSLIEVKFEILDNGIREFDFNQILLLAFVSEDETINKPYNQFLHEGFNQIEGIGHKFHRAYNAIQYQNSDSIASKLLISAIFDTFDIDFSKGTLIGGDTSKFFVGNRIKGKTTPIIYGKFANKIIDTTTEEFEYLSGLTITEIETELIGKSCVLSEDMSIVEFYGTAEDGYYRLRLYEDTSGCKVVSKFEHLNYNDVPSVNPIYNNEDTFTTEYITNNAVFGDVYYPPSQGVIFEYNKNGQEDQNLYYYVISPFIDSGFKNAPSCKDLINEALYTYGNEIREESLENTPVVGTKLDSGCNLSYVTVMHISCSMGGLLSEDQSEWKYNSFGELIINKNQIVKTYPIL